MKASSSFFNGSAILTVDYYHDGDSQAIVQAEAIKLYEASTDPEKTYPVITPEQIDGLELPPYLDTDNVFAIAASEKYIEEQSEKSESAVAAISAPYNGSLGTTMNHYGVSRGTLTIENLTTESIFPGMRVTAVEDESILSSLIKSNHRSDDNIQILISVDGAAKVLGINKPTSRDLDRDAKIIDYINEVNRRATNATFFGMLTNDAEGAVETKITYEIVGLLPYYEPPKVVEYSIDPVDMLINTLPGDNYPIDSFIVTNPDSAVFRSTYDREIYNDLYSTRVLTEFSSIEGAEAFMKEYNCGEESCELTIISKEFINNQHNLAIVIERAERVLAAFVVIVVVLAIIVMAGTIYRVVGDEYRAIALYRAVGASVKDILQIFAGYVLTLCLLIIICSAIIGIVLSAIISVTHSVHFTAVVAEMYNVSGLQGLTLIGMDYRLWLVVFAIIAVGAVCFSFIINKLVSSNIVKTLRGV